MMKWQLVAAGILIGAWTSWNGKFVIESWTPLACGLGIVGLLILEEQRWKLGFLFVFAFFYGLSSVAVSQERWSHSAWRAPGKVIVMSGMVKTFPEKSYGKYKWQFQCDQFRMEEGPWHNTKSKVEITIPATEAAPVIGDYLLIKGTVRFPRADEPGAGFMKSNFFLKGVQAQIRVNKFGNMIHEGWNGWFFPLRVLQLARESFADKLEKNYSPEQAQVMKALLFGIRMSDHKIRMMFARSGTSHLLSVSGFHTTVVAGMIFSIVILCRFKPAAAVIWAGTGVLAYMALANWGIAIQRAGAMAIFVWAAWAGGRSQRLLYWLTVVLAGILWANPLQTGSISFQLSFLSMYGILSLTPHLAPRIRIPGMDVGLAAFLATYPMLLYHFQSFAWTGIFCNLIAVPTFALILPLGFFSLIPAVGVPACVLTKGLLSLILIFLEKVAVHPASVMMLPQPKEAWIFLYYFWGGLWLWLIRHRGARPLSFVRSIGF